MKSFLTYIKGHYHFLLVTIIYILSGTVLLSIFEKGEVVIWVNENNTIFGDYLFYYATKLAEFWSVAILALILLYFNWRVCLLFLGNLAINSIIIQTLKRVVFKGYFRPAKHLGIEYHQVLGEAAHFYHSFPSGHTNTAFCVFMFAALYFRNNLLSLLFAFLSISVAYSRMYLFQHFLVDTVVGALIGVVVTAVFYYTTAERNVRI